ncbi:thiamine pyrophosphate-binding protein [Pseudonocardia sp. RS010]|uniref:thiamine pyrophosphate-binding protein n=1 Tax=Pseudonocardia sp. RS010 TaxID=3385979 RepID=UPI0039A1ED79
MDFVASVNTCVAEALLRFGPRIVFGVLGDANMVYMHGFVGSGGTYIGAVDERAALMMAVGSAQTADDVGCATVTHGPGLTNTVTSLVEAVRGRTPLVLLTGETPPVHDYVQAIEIAPLVLATGALYRRVLDPTHVGADVRAAFRLAEGERRPVVLDIPFALLDQDAGPLVLGPSPARQRQRVSPDPDVVDEALGVLASAQRPVVLAGRGASSDGARTALLRLADALGAPLGTTLLGRDLFRGERWDLGVIGTLSDATALDVVSSSDCVIAFGASLNHYTTDRGWLRDQRAVVHVDIDPGQLGRFGAVTADVLGDAEIVATQMAQALAESGHKASSFRSPALGERLAARDPRCDFLDTSANGFVDARLAMIRLDEVLPSDRIVVTDVARFAAAPWKYLHASSPQAFTHTANFGSIGLGLPAAIGASASDSSRVTVAVAGDGGAMMAIAELATVARLRLPMVIVVVNDNCYGAEWSSLERRGLDPKLSLTPWPSFAEVARGMGVSGLTVRTEAELDEVGRRVAEGDMPLVVDLRVDPAVDIGGVR